MDRKPVSADSIAALRVEAADCRACPLWKDATQTVFGEGPAHARLMLVGEQPGDREDRAGKPFVGPAGNMLDRALEEAGIDREKIYITNAVKHFKFVARGKIRLHQKPSTSEIKACRQWYERELAAIKPDLVVAMGATAAQCVFGRITPINKNRGKPVTLGHTTQALVRPTCCGSRMRKPKRANTGALSAISSSRQNCSEVPRPWPDGFHRSGMQNPVIREKFPQFPVQPLIDKCYHRILSTIGSSRTPGRSH